MNPLNHDSDSVDFKIGGEVVGKGYRGRDDGRFYILRCPRCQRENYAPLVAQGGCAWCNYLYQE